ncbi:breast cancer anti-estrogen resistance protein 1 isoform X1 [Electrophorus electricus]|uniref:breast cancer anti-estrogen resistance protein 1 isoform X1 n=2 Tax=Electrophorus electricus TaxID=8005 RepID=UPI0015CFC49C|nr:breast cancer anti-estrogen resistance protein 1 isoform X1 [Electrophorus electricus]
MSVPVFCKMFHCLQGAPAENVLAKALYDNVAESPDELSFRKGDIMTVLERDTQGLDGWWLCSLHGRQGIVPGNRLKILVGMYDKQQQPSTPSPAQSHLSLPANAYTKPSPAAQYTAMHPAAPCTSLPGLYQVPAGSQGSQPKAPALTQKQGPGKYHAGGQDIYQVPPSMGGPGQEVYQVPHTAGGQDVYQVPPSMNQKPDIYQIPPSLDKRSWDSSKTLGKVVVPTRVGQMYVYDTPKMDQDEYDVPRHLPPSQEIYDVPPTRAQYNQQVYDTPPMAMKGPISRDAQEVYDTPPSIDKNQLLSQQMVYDFPPSVSKDVPDGPIREETYDIPPHFAKLKSLDCQIAASSEPPIPEDVYDVPPPPLTGKLQQEIYDIPTSLRKGGLPEQHATDVYDIPRERGPPGEESGDYIYDVPPQVVRDAAGSEELTVSFKRLSASSTGSTRSNLSTSSLDMVPVRESAGPARLLPLDLDQAMERLSRLQQGVESSASLLMSFISGNWRSATQMESNLPAIRQASERLRASVRDLLEFARGAVANAAQATDRTLQAKLSKQVQKMEEAFQSLVKHSQALDALGWAPAALMVPPAGGGGDDLDRLVMCARGVPDDTKQLASFLHGNASLLFKRTNKQQQLPLPPVPHISDPMGQLTNNNNGSAYQTATPERANIQSRPLPSPPKFTAEEETPDRPYEVTGEGWMEDYDYVHLQGKEEFEKNQRQLLEKGNITRQNKTQLEQQQLKQFERLEQEVTRPINNDISGWTPPTHYPPPSRSKLCVGDRQLLLFYSEQCEANITTLTNAIDAFFSSINNNQPPKIFVAHSKFVILSAHKLVFIGDTLSRQAKCPEVRSRVAQHSNVLCDKLKDIVVSTKTAALQYPSPGAARDMTERVRELAGCTQQFRMALNQMLTM